MTLEKLVTEGVFKTIERTGLRYVNVFTETLLNISNVAITVIDNDLKNQCTTLRSEIPDGEFMKIVQLSNNAKITRGNSSFTGSALDIDILMTTRMDSTEFEKRIRSIVQDSHDKEKELFFNILKEEFIETLEPEYGGEA